MSDHTHHCFPDAYYSFFYLASPAAELDPLVAYQPYLVPSLLSKQTTEQGYVNKYAR